MSLVFRCPHCQLETLVDDEFAGHTGPCAGCGKTITVPLSSSHTAQGIKTRTSSGIKPGGMALLIILAIAGASIVFLALVTFVFPSLHYAQDLVHKTQCRNNLLRIASALRQYEVEHGTLPPAYLPDANGKPMHSWRVLILPQLGEAALFSRYHFDEPWNGPNNIQLVSQMPDVYGCPADPDAKAKGETTYMVVVGPMTLFPGSNAMRTADVRDDTSSTILVAETPVIGAVWLEPKDFNATRMQFMINSSSVGEIGSYHKQGAHVIMVDQSVRFLNQLFPADYLQGMTTIRGNEDIPREVLD